MSSRGLLFGVLLGLGGAGCLTGRPSANSGFLHLFVRNTVEAPCEAVDEQCFKFKSWWRARNAFDELGLCRPNESYSSDFREGFLEGYVDYLDAGGNGNPPTVPPARYWQTKYQNPEGVRAVQDWFDGFRAGAASARASGFRDTIIVPLSSPLGHAVSGSEPALEQTPTPRPFSTEEVKPEPDSRD